MLSDARDPCNEAILRSRPEVKDCGAKGPWVLAAAILGSSITFIDGTVVNLALPVLQSKLGASVSEAQWIVESYALMLASLLLVGGSIGDRLGRKRVFSAGALFFGLASVWCGIAPSTIQLIIARGAQGVGAALLVPGSLALISANFSKQRRGRAIGTWSAFTSIAAGAGPILGGWLVETFSWRWIFFINLPLAATVLLISWRQVPESRDEQAKGVDFLGGALATLGLTGIVFGLIESNTRSMTSPVVTVSIAAGLAALAGFFTVEARRRDPMMPLGLFRSATFAGANLLTFFLYAALGGILFFLPFNLIQVQGYSPTAAGAALLPFVLTMFLLSRWAGGLVDHFGSKLPLVVGPLVAAAGFALFALPGPQAGNYWANFFPAVTVMSLGMALSVAPLTTTVMGAVEERYVGVASGINNAVARTASLLAVAVFGVFLLSSFQANLSGRLSAMPIPPEERARVLGHSGDLANIRIPDTLGKGTQAGIRQAIQESFVEGFRLVSWLAAGLAAASALASWLLIAGKRGPGQSASASN